ncbi:MAG TPA: hypothetical protein VFH17_00105 [Coriobacteriia bacterium]|nr:hypothetical protein [Coriobacteriia bacterium]
MDERPIELPGSRWEWLVAKKRLVAVLAIVAVALVGGTAALVLALLPESASPGADRPRVVEPVPAPSRGEDRPGAGTGSSAAPGAPGGVTGSRDGTAGAGPPADPPRPVVPGRAPYLAYRYDGGVWVSREDGTGAVMVAASPHGTFALAPDGTALALVHEGVLSIITVDGRQVIEVGEAEPDGLAWAADSSAVFFVRSVQGRYGVTEVYRASRRAGDIAVRIAQGAAPAVARDGTVAGLPVAAIEPEAAASEVWVLAFGSDHRQVATRGLVTCVDVEAGTLAYSIVGMANLATPSAGASDGPEIWAMRADGTAQRRVVGTPMTPWAFAFAGLMLSPDGAHLLYAEVGDDGHSRAAVVPLAGGDPVALSVRRDTYPAGWSADGSRVFFIEGNAFQGEATALVSAGADGLDRRTVVIGAGL